MAELIKCCSCGKLKPASEFSWKNKAKGRRQSRCKECQCSYQRLYYREHIERYRGNGKYSRSIRKNNTRYYKTVQLFIWKYLEEHPCIDCGESDPVVLDFDHVAGKKVAGVADLRRRAVSLDRVKSEIAKCEVHCANCHRRRHARERGRSAHCDSLE